MKVVLLEVHCEFTYTKEGKKVLITDTSLSLPIQADKDNPMQKPYGRVTII